MKKMLELTPVVVDATVKKTKKATKEEEPSILETTLILYTDGSCGPTNPGPWSYGIHGYLYINSEAGIKKHGDKPPKNHITDEGYVEINSKPASTYKEVAPVFYLDAFRAFDDIGTNNTGELKAIVDAIEYASEDLEYDGKVYKITKLIVKSDSKYAIGVHRVIDNGKIDWRKKEPKNPGLWEEMEKVVKDSKERGLVVETMKVKGHSTDVGNNISDRLAFIGRYKTSKKSIAEKKFITTTSKKYWKPVVDKHPLLDAKEIYFLDDSTAEEKSYVVMNYPTDVETGKKSALAGLGVVVVDGAGVERLERMKKFFRNMLGSLYLLSRVDLKNVYLRQAYHLFNIFGEDALVSHTRGKKLVTVVEEDIVVNEIKPPGLAQQTFNKVANLVSMYNIYNDVKTNPKAGDEKTYDIINLNKIIYKTDAKGKNVCQLENNQKELDIGYEGHKLFLTLSTELVSRNQLKRIEGLNPVIDMMIVKHPKFYEYHCFITYDGVRSVWSNEYINKIYI